MNLRILSVVQSHSQLALAGPPVVPVPVAVGAGVGPAAPEVVACLFHGGRACTRDETESRPSKVAVVAVLPDAEARSIFQQKKVIGGLSPVVEACVR